MLWTGAATPGAEGAATIEVGRGSLVCGCATTLLFGRVDIKGVSGAATEVGEGAMETGVADSTGETGAGAGAGATVATVAGPL